MSAVIPGAMEPISGQRTIFEFTLVAARSVVGDPANVYLKRVQGIVGVKLGQHIYNYVNGTDNSPVLAEVELSKGYSNSTTLARYITTADAAYKVFLALADSVAMRMVADCVNALCISSAQFHWEFSSF